MQNVEHFSAHTEFYTDEGCYITELHNSDADEGCSIARARVGPGITTRLHRLEGTVERYVILEGTAEVTVGNARLVKVEPLDIVNIPAGAAQCIRNTGEGDLVFLCICTPRFRQNNYEALEES